jgi:hypothetical protein
MIIVAVIAQWTVARTTVFQRSYCSNMLQICERMLEYSSPPSATRKREELASNFSPFAEDHPALAGLVRVRDYLRWRRSVPRQIGKQWGCIYEQGMKCVSKTHDP